MAICHRCRHFGLRLWAATGKHLLLECPACGEGIAVAEKRSRSERRQKALVAGVPGERRAHQRRISDVQ